MIIVLSHSSAGRCDETDTFLYWVRKCEQHIDLHMSPFGTKRPQVVGVYHVIAIKLICPAGDVL